LKIIPHHSNFVGSNFKLACPQIFIRV